MEHAHAVVANTVAALKACGDKYGDDLLICMIGFPLWWMANVRHECPVWTSVDVQQLFASADSWRVRLQWRSKTLCMHGGWPSKHSAQTKGKTGQNANQSAAAYAAAFAGTQG